MNKDRDQLAKRILEETLDPVGTAQREQEVDPSDLQRMDLWFRPGPLPARPQRPRHLRVLYEMVEEACIFEAFSRPPDVPDVLQCLRKQLGWWHRLWLDLTPKERRAQGPQGTAPALPPLWVLSSGRPSRALVHLLCEPMAGWPAGFYRLAPWTRAAIVVLSDLEESRETLVLRLMGPARVRNAALAELRSLPADDPEHRPLSDLLGALQYAIARDSLIPQAEREHFMTAARAEYLKFKEELIEQGREEGLDKGRKVARESLLKYYEHRFGPMPAEVRDALVALKDLDRLHALISVVLDGSAEDFARQVLAR